MTGRVPFDSDEAVEGLMALHVLKGEFPVFFWGQAFKGVPEVYASALAFSLFGPSVTTLKAVTLAMFAAYVGLNYILIARLVSRWSAAAASTLLIVSPPALVFWSLDASAEYVIVMLLGTLLLLLVSETPRWQAAIGLVCGVGLWVHQLFAIYLLPVLLIVALRHQWWTRLRAETFGRGALALGAVGALYGVLALTAFVTGGFSFEIASVAVSVTAPQKMLRIAVALAALSGLVHLATHTTRDQLGTIATTRWALAAGFLAGYSPVLLYSLLIEPARSPARVADLRDLATAAPDIFGNILPILAGFKIATTERLAVPAIAACPVVASLLTYLLWHRRRLSQAVTCRAQDASIAADFFPLFVVFVPLLFLASGAYLDTQSYRYLVPWYAGLVVAVAGGSLILARHRTALATAIVMAVAAVHGWQQVLWYHKLAPDTQSSVLIACLKEEGIRGGFADYWTAYKLTFLTGESIVVAPTNGVDRYPAYTAFVRSLPEAQRSDNAGGCVNAGSGAGR